MKEQPPKQIYKYLKFNKNTEDILKNRRFYLEKILNLRQKFCFC